MVVMIEEWPPTPDSQNDYLAMDLNFSFDADECHASVAPVLSVSRDEAYLLQYHGWLRVGANACVEVVLILEQLHSW